jgi:type II secretion system protein N
MIFFGSPLRFIGFLLYGIILTGVLLYVRFPTEKFISYCQEKLATAIPGTSWNIGNIRYLPPLTVSFGDVRAGGKDPESGELAVRVIDVSMVSLRDVHRYSFTATAYDGAAEGQLIVSPGGEVDINDLVMRDMDLEKLAADLRLDNRKISGTLFLTGKYSSGGEKKAQGEAQIELKDGTVELLQPILSMEELQFSMVSTKIDYRDDIIHLDKGTVDGNELFGSFAGEISSSWPLREAMLTISGQVGVSEEFLQARPQERRLISEMQSRLGKDTLPFFLGGSLGNPTFGFGR